MNLRELTKGVPSSTTLAKLVSELEDMLSSSLNVPVALDPQLLKPPPVNAGVGGDIGIPCFDIAKQLRQSPNVIAQRVAEKFSPSGYLNTVIPVGAYCNVQLNRKTFIADLLAEVTGNLRDYGSSNVGQAKRVMVEYSSPNTNKPQHLGHVRNNILGHAVANLLQAVGFFVIKTSIVNDRGIHICKSMLAYQKWGKGATPESTGKKSDHFVGDYYVLFEIKLKEERAGLALQQGIDFSKMTDVDKAKWEDAFLKVSSLMAEAQGMLQAWENGDTNVLMLWRQMNTWVLDGFKQTYNELGVDFDHTYFESDIFREGKDLILKALAEGKLKKRADGVIVAELSKISKLPDKVVLRSDGTSIYITQDMALAKKKFEDFDLDYSIYCIASEQDTYVAQVIATLKLMGFSFADAMFHLSYGMVELPTGKMKSREGTVVDADDLVFGMRAAAAEEIQKRNPELLKTEVQRRGKIIGDSALKFFLQSYSRQAKILFDPQKSLSPEGATGPYLQYANARISSIFRKLGSGEYPVPKSITVSVDAEWALAWQLARYPTVVYKAAMQCEPSELAQYLYELVSTFGTYYRDTSILQSENELRAVRVNLIASVQAVLKNGLRYLDIETLEEM